MEAGTNPSKISLLFAETCGTAIFISCIFYTALYQTNPLAIAVGVGGGLFIAIAIFGRETGGHFNPAVSIGYYFFIVENRLEKVSNFILMLLGQVLGGLVAGSLLYFTANENEPVLKPDEDNLLGSFLDEIFFTFLFLSVIYCVKSPVLSMTKDGALGVMTVCITLALCVLYGGQISGACYNPAVGIAMNFWATFANKDRRYIKYVSYYIMAPVIGGLMAGFLNRYFLSLPFSEIEKAKADGEEQEQILPSDSHV